MSFTSILRTIVDECGGGLSAILMGSDGIPIEQVEATGIGSEESEWIATAAIEFGRILAEVRKASDAAAGGAVQETMIGLTRGWLLLRPLDDETFLLVAVAPDGNLGKARFLMRRHLLTLRYEI
jgi:predicted regulator of Ras-like GTPase activity (Roadblock/LC7/MglB family)